LFAPHISRGGGEQTYIRSEVEVVLPQVPTSVREKNTIKEKGGNKLKKTRKFGYFRGKLGDWNIYKKDLIKPAQD